MCLCKPKPAAKPASCSSHIDGNPFVGLPNSHLTTTETFCLKCTGVVITLSYQSDVHPKPCSTGLTWHGAGRSANLPCHALLQNTVLQKKTKASPSYDPRTGCNRTQAHRKQEIFSCKNKGWVGYTCKADMALPCTAHNYMGKSALFFS